MDFEKVKMSDLEENDRLKESFFSSFRSTYNLAGYLKGEEYQAVLTAIQILNSNLLSLIISSLNVELNERIPEIKESMNSAMKELIKMSDHILEHHKKRRETSN